MKRTRDKTKPVHMKQRFSMKLMWKQKYLLLMSLPFVIWIIVFKYLPLWGWTMAFQDVRPKTFSLPIWKREFVGLEQFIKLFKDPRFYEILRNTIGTSLIGIVMGFFSSILFALFLNEIRQVRFKKMAQTISYLPHFVSWVIIASVAKMFLVVRIFIFESYSL